MLLLAQLQRLDRPLETVHLAVDALPLPRRLLERALLLGLVPLEQLDLLLELARARLGLAAAGLDLALEELDAVAQPGDLALEDALAFVEPLLVRGLLAEELLEREELLVGAGRRVLRDFERARRVGEVFGEGRDPSLERGRLEGEGIVGLERSRLLCSGRSV